MAATRHYARIVAMQSLYEWQLHPQVGLNEVIERNLEDKDFDDNNKTFLLKITEGTEKELKEIDNIIQVAAPEWPIEQISQIDLAVLRIAVFEIIFDDEVPPKAAINEAVELAKEFGGETSSKFVNGVLGTVFRSSSKYDPERDEKPGKKKEDKPAKNPADNQADGKDKGGK